MSNLDWKVSQGRDENDVKSERIKSVKLVSSTVQERVKTIITWITRGSVISTP